MLYSFSTSNILNQSPRYFHSEHTTPVKQPQTPSTTAVATVLPVYYEKDANITTLPVLKTSSSSTPSSNQPTNIVYTNLISNSANSGVGSATAIITVNNGNSNNMSSGSISNLNTIINNSNINLSPNRVGLVKTSTGLESPSSSKLINKPYSIIKGIKVSNTSSPSTPTLNTTTSTGGNTKMNGNNYVSSQLVSPSVNCLNVNAINSMPIYIATNVNSSNFNNGSSFTQQPSQQPPQQKSILVNKKKFANPPNSTQSSSSSSSSYSPFMPKKTVTFAN